MCRWRPPDRQQAEVRQLQQRELLRRLRRAEFVDFSRAGLDSELVRAKRMAKIPGKTRGIAARILCLSTGENSQLRSG